MSRSPNPPAQDTKPAETAARQDGVQQANKPAETLRESREDRRLGFLLCFIGIVLMALPWLVPGSVQGLSRGLIIGKIAGACFLAAGIFRAWTAHKSLTARQREMPTT